MLAVRAAPWLAAALRKQSAFALSCAALSRNAVFQRLLPPLSAPLARALSSTSSRKRIGNDTPRTLARQPPAAAGHVHGDFQPLVLQHNDSRGILRMLSAGASAQLVFWLWCGTGMPCTSSCACLHPCSGM
jgi:hypothetical protein